MTNLDLHVLLEKINSHLSIVVYANHQQILESIEEVSGLAPDDEVIQELMTLARDHVILSEGIAELSQELERKGIKEIRIPTDDVYESYRRWQDKYAEYTAVRE